MLLKNVLAQLEVQHHQSMLQPLRLYKNTLTCPGVTLATNGKHRPLNCVGACIVAEPQDYFGSESEWSMAAAQDEGGRLKFWQ